MRAESFGEGGEKMKREDKIYLDHCATEPVDEDVWKVIEESVKSSWYNCSSRYEEAERCRRRLEDCERRVKECLGAEDYDVVFTSGSSESAAMVASITKNIGGKGVCGVWEHKCVTKNCDKIVDNLGELEKEISTGKGKFVYLMGVNNISGEVYDIRKLSKKKNKGNYLCCDGTQMLGKMKVDLSDGMVDYWWCSGHKCGCPKGIGVLVMRRNAPHGSLIKGGKQQHGLRAGTENLAFIEGFTYGIEGRNDTEYLRDFLPHCHELKTLLYQRLQNEFTNYVILSPSWSVDGIANITFEKVDGETLALWLDSKGIMVSAGAACNGDEIGVEPTIELLHLPENYKYGSIRISFGIENTKDDINKLIDELKEILQKTRGFI